MQIGSSISHWITVLAALAAEWRLAAQARKSIVVTENDGRLELRRSDAKDKAIVAELLPGESLTRETAAALRNQCILFEVADEHVVTRKLSVPAKAQDFLAGIIGNQIERLSPWPLNQAAYGFEAMKNVADAHALDVTVFIVARTMIAQICDRLKAQGLVVDRIVAPRAVESKATPVVVWTRPSLQTGDQAQSLRRTIATALASLVLVSVLVSGWALYSANAASQADDEATQQIAEIERHDQASRHAHPRASRDPAEQAWISKETTATAFLTLETLARALPDSAYLTELHLENATLRIVGLATDPPSLIAALERSKHFTSVHFFAPTTKDPDGVRYRFYIEARVDDHFATIGE